MKFAPVSKFIPSVDYHLCNVQEWVEKVESTAVHENNQPFITWASKKGKCNIYVEARYQMVREAARHG